MSHQASLRCGRDCRGDFLRDTLDNTWGWLAKTCLGGVICSEGTNERSNANKFIAFPQVWYGRFEIDERLARTLEASVSDSLRATVPGPAAMNNGRTPSVHFGQQANISYDLTKA